MVNNKTVDCVSYHLGKEHKLLFHTSQTTYNAPLQLVALDVWGPTPICSNGFTYYVAFTYAHTRYIWIYFLKKKSKLPLCFLSFTGRLKEYLRLN